LQDENDLSEFRKVSVRVFGTRFVLAAASFAKIGIFITMRHRRIFIVGRAVFVAGLSGRGRIIAQTTARKPAKAIATAIKRGDCRSDGPSSD
jgi:hypothetical protein